MSNLSPDKVLRVNCSGWGSSCTLPLGEAKPLAMYDVLVVNPVSIVHLFEPESEVARRSERLISEGVSSINLEKDSVLESISHELELREHELRQFLSRGGLLICFMQPPFIANGAGLSMDNYLWMHEFAPYKSSPGLRALTASVGKDITLSVAGKNHPFAAFLKQEKLHWSSFIRKENLRDGYKCLASAGSDRCVAAYKSTGPLRGQVLLLPAPEKDDYDEILKECILRWYELHSGPDADKEEPDYPEEEATQDVEGRDLIGSLFAGRSESVGKQSEKSSLISSSCASADEIFSAGDSLNRHASGSTVFASEKAVSDDLDLAFEKLLPGESEKVVGKNAGDRGSEKSPAFEKKTKDEQMKPSAEEDPALRWPEAGKSDNNNGEEIMLYPDAKTLMSRMEQEISGPGTPEWCSRISFSELADMNKELAGLQEQVKAALKKIDEVEQRIRNLAETKDALLSLSGSRLAQACCKVFQSLGWAVKISDSDTSELWLSEGDKVQAILRLAFSQEQPNRSELAELAESVITYWGKHDLEPRGILVASTYAGRHPDERPSEDFPESMQEFARRKNLCLMSSAQVLSIYREAGREGADLKTIRDSILNTDGLLKGFKLEIEAMAESSSAG